MGPKKITFYYAYNIMLLSHIIFLMLCYFKILCVCVLFRATPMAYGHSQVRGQIRAVAASLHHSHSNARSELCL